MGLGNEGRQAGLLLLAPDPVPLPPQGDLGGKKILQKKWTSFLKARLICHIPQYETLRAVCSLETDASARTHFYAAFILTTQWSVPG